MTSDPNNRLWVLHVLIIFFGAASMLALTNILVDPYDYFGVGPWDGSGLTNERLWKPQYFDENRSNYDSLYLGSSTASQVYPWKISEVLPDTSFYNFGLSGGNLYDYEVVLSHFAGKGLAAKRIVVQIDLTAIWMYGIKPQYYKRYGPQITGENEVAYYAAYLFRFHQRGTITKIRHRIFGESPLPHNSYDRATGVFYFPHRDNLIAQDHSAFMAAYDLSENRLDRVGYGMEALDDSLGALQEIVSMAEASRSELMLIVSPPNYNLMNSHSLSDYVALLRGIARLHPFWDFSGYNSITMNSRLFYDRDHFRPEIGDMIIARVFDGDTSSVPGDFGQLVNASNIEERVSRVRSEFEWADRVFAVRESAGNTPLEPSWPLREYLASKLAP